MDESRVCRHLYQICPQTKGRFKGQPYYVRSLTDVSERGRPRDLRLWYRSDALITIKKVWSLARADANIMGENRCDRIVALHTGPVTNCRNGRLSDVDQVRLRHLVPAAPSGDRAYEKAGKDHLAATRLQ
jgi:hypothetical protein